MKRHDGPGSADAPSGAPEVLIRRSYDWSETPPSLAIVDALSQLDDGPFESDSGTSHSPSTSLSLSNHLDPDALDALFTRQSAETPRVAVTIEGYQVRIADGEVVVRAGP